MAVYQQKGIPFFNPQVDGWKPELAEEEARHLANDSIILFPVTRETYGFGSLSEVGFSILQAIRLNSHRDVVIFVDKSLDKALKRNRTLAEESLRARQLVLAHLKKLNLSNVYIVNDLEQMLALSIVLYNSAWLKASAVGQVLGEV
jgi:hypothetical protein